MFNNTNLVGSYMVNKSNYMYNFYINKIFRGNKYSNNLIKHCVDTNGNNLNNPLTLHVSSKNKKAIYLYEKHGFLIDESIYDTKTNDLFHKMTFIK